MPSNRSDDRKVQPLDYAGEGGWRSRPWERWAITGLAMAYAKIVAVFWRWMFDHSKLWRSLNGLTFDVQEKLVPICVLGVLLATWAVVPAKSAGLSRDSRIKWYAALAVTFNIAVILWNVLSE